MHIVTLVDRAEVFTVNEAIAFGGASLDLFSHLSPTLYHEPRFVKHGNQWIDVQDVEISPDEDWDAKSGFFMIKYLNEGFIRLGLMLSQ